MQRNLIVLVGVLVSLSITAPAVGQRKTPDPYRDYLVKAYPAQMTADLPEASVLNWPKEIPCGKSVILSKLRSIIPPYDDSRTVYVFHVGKWESRGGSYAMKSSTWVAYWMHRERSQDGSKVCALRQTGFNANGTPLIYADKHVWLIGINYFDKEVPLGTITIGYKLANVPVPPQNVQDLGALIIGVLGATIPSPTPGAPQSVKVSAGSVPSYITVGKFDFFKRFPQSLTFTLSLSVNQPGALPSARIGVPYSGSVSASGGTGVYSYTVARGSLPPGLGLDRSTGMISGTPIAAEARTYGFYISVSDTSSPPNTSVTEGAITLSNSVVLQNLTLVNGTSANPVSLPDARTYSPYNVILVPSFSQPSGSPSPALPVPPFRFTKDANNSVNADWISVDPSDGFVHGTPTNGGPTTLAIGIADSSVPQGKSVGTIIATFNVLPLASGGGDNPLAIPLPDAAIGQFYDFGLATGSASTSTLAESGDLPQGLTFNSTTGEITGTPVDENEAGKAFPISVQVTSSQANVGSPQNGTGTAVAKSYVFTLKVAELPKPKDSQTNADVTFDIKGGKSAGNFPQTAVVGKSYSATISIVGPDGKYLIFTPCGKRPPTNRNADQADIGCTARSWFDPPPSLMFKNLPPDKGEINGNEGSLELTATPLAAGSVGIAITICQEKSTLVQDTVLDNQKQLLKSYTSDDCEPRSVASYLGNLKVEAPPLQALVLILGAGTSQSANNKGNPSLQGPSPSPGGGQQQAAASAANPSQGGGGGGGKGSGGGGANPTTPSNPANPQAVDCSITNSQTPCTVSDTFLNNDREAFDFSVGVNVPGVKEAKYTVIYNPPSVVTHTDLYALVDLYPLAIVQHFTNWSAIAYMPSKESWVPHFNVGIPVASQPFHLPYFGMAENLTTWTKLEKIGFPIRINVFAGVVLLKQQIVSGASTSSPSLVWDRALKPMYGIEVPIGALASKIGSALSGSKGGGSSAK